MSLLHIDSSILGDNSISRQVSAAIATAITNDAPATQVVYRDLAADPIAHLSGAYLGGAAPQADQEDGAKVLEDFLAADTIVIGAPMYNFAISPAFTRGRTGRMSCGRPPPGRWRPSAFLL